MRIKNNLTQEQLAEKLFVTRTAVSKRERNGGHPNVDSLKLIAEFFSISLDDLLYYSITKLIEQKHKKM